MTLKKEYTEKDRMRDVIEDNSALLMAISRFGISLGFGDSSVSEVCRSHNVDCGTFLTVANFISGNEYKHNDVSISSLMDYLKSAHAYFLEFSLPSIRRKLIEAINCRDEDNVSMLVLKFFDNYVSEVENHMKYENEHVFAYVEDLLNNKVHDNMSIANYSARHNSISAKLKELKDIIIGYYPLKNSDLINSVLFDIIVCEQDLVSHCDIEDKIFVPEVKLIEDKLKLDAVNAGDAEARQEENDSERIDALSDREKEIVRCVAKGMSNKEIADELCLSIHTVTTHRRNLCSKLQIHSPAGLTIFAIINNLVSLDEVKHLK
jgi:regulator of cell morphogenesis and NO signaling